jgi:hypothetical protein
MTHTVQVSRLILVTQSLSNYDFNRSHEEWNSLLNDGGIWQLVQKRTRRYAFFFLAESFYT